MGAENMNGMNGMHENGSQNQEFDLKRIFYLLLSRWYWIVLGLIVSYAAAWAILRYTPSIYAVSGRILVNEDQQQPISENIIAQELGFTAGNSMMENELQIFGASTMMQQVVDSLNLEYSYFQEGRIKDSEVYTSSPVRLTEASPRRKAYGKSLRIKTLNNENFILFQGENDTIVQTFDVPFRYNQVNFVLSRHSRITPGNIYNIKIHSPSSVARKYARKLNINRLGTSNVITINMRDENPYKAIEVIKTLIGVYNKSVINKKNESGEKTLKFIDERLDFITTELYDVEKEVEDFKQSKSYPIGIEPRAQEYLSRVNSAESELISLQVNEDLLNNFKAYMLEDSNQYAILPITSEMIRGTLLANINSYNSLIFKRRNFFEGSTPENPFYATIDEELNFFRQNIFLGINTLFEEIKRKRALIQERMKPLEEEINTIPTNQRELLQIMRQQQIKESLFLYLLQKREETALSIAAQVSNLRILEPVISNGVVAPNRQRYFLLSIFLGLALPVGIILGVYFMDNNVYNRQDIEAITRTPYLGSIGQSPKNQTIVIQKSSRSSIAEMFRLLRTNLQYVQTSDKDHQTILVTSSVSGEGKSFITINLGISEALSGKKTILLGFDLRKPKLSEYLVGSREGLGLTHYLVGGAELDDIIRPIPNYENIDFISCGAIPPNPAELIMLQQTRDLFDQLKRRYDRIIIDTPPVGLVTDALLFKDIVDKSIIAVRSGKTKKGLIKMINDIYTSNKLPKMGIVLNGVKKKSAYGYGGYGYGYGYNYGYGYGYYDDDQKKKGRWKVFTRS